jgi:hypothetical protein
MFRPILTALLLVSSAAPTVAQTAFVPPPSEAARTTPPPSSLDRSLTFDLRRYGFDDVDVRRLSTAQRAAIHHFAHSDLPESQIRSQIGATLRGGLLQRLFDRPFS